MQWSSWSAVTCYRDVRRTLSDRQHHYTLTRGCSALWFGPFHYCFIFGLSWSHYPDNGPCWSRQHYYTCFVCINKFKFTWKRQVHLPSCCLKKLFNSAQKDLCCACVCVYSRLRWWRKNISLIRVARWAQKTGCKEEQVCQTRGWEVSLLRLASSSSLSADGATASRLRHFWRQIACQWALWCFSIKSCPMWVVSFGRA